MAREVSMDDMITINMPRHLVEKLAKPWYLIKQWDAKVIRECCEASLGDSSDIEPE